MDKVELGSDDFKALSSETRTKIIKLLDERNHNLTELSSKLGIAPPTVKKHLDTLSNSNMIEPIEDNRKWKYYRLSRKGKKIVTPEKNYIFILFSVAAIAMVGLLFMGMYSTMQNPMEPVASLGMKQNPAANMISPQEFVENTGYNAESIAVSREKDLNTDLNKHDDLNSAHALGISPDQNN